MSAHCTGVVLHIDLTRLQLDDSLKSGLTISFSAEGKTCHHEYPLTRPVSISLKHTNSNVRVSFIAHENEIASGYLPVPEHKGPRLTFKDTFTCALKNVYVSDTKFFAEFSIDAEYENNDEPQEEVRQEIATSTLVGNSFSPLKSSFRGTGKLVSQGETSPLRDRVNPSHPTKADKSYKFKEEELHGYLSRVVSSHMQ
jgi:hypothetical protein